MLDPSTTHLRIHADASREFYANQTTYSIRNMLTICVVFEKFNA